MPCDRFIGTGIKQHRPQEDHCSMPLSLQLNNSKGFKKHYSFQPHVKKEPFEDVENDQIYTKLDTDSSTRQSILKHTACGIHQKQLTSKRFSTVSSIEKHSQASYVTFENNTKFRIPIEMEIMEKDKPLDQGFKIEREKHIDVVSCNIFYLL